VRIAWITDLAGVVFDDRVKQVVNAQRGTFEALGCAVNDATLDLTEADEVFRVLRAWSFELQHGAKLKLYRHLIKDTVIEEIERGMRLTGPQLSRAEVQ